MALPQILTVEDVKVAARRAYEAGKLTAQHPDPAKRECIYDGGDGYHCAIGAALSEDALAEVKARSLNLGSGFIVLREKGIVECTEAEHYQFREIQQAHDQWAASAAVPEKVGPALIEQRRDAFLRCIDIEPPKE